ncbi:MAG: deoxyribose-phosphate aldolase [Ilumatobacteraceae bacterium]
MRGADGHGDPAAIARRALALLDLTELGNHADDDAIVQLCDRAVTSHGHVAAVCVWPRHVALAARELMSSPVRIATVVNFPSGDEAVTHVVAVTEQALADGAHEFDLVLPYHAYLDGAIEHVALMLETVRATTASARATLKVILETGELGGLDHVEAASRLAIAHGADFVKTSTGTTPVSATLDATAVMLRTIAAAGRPVGLKPSGGIRTLAQAAQYLDQAEQVMGPSWATPSTFRFGASSLLEALLEALDGGIPPAGTSGTGTY